MLKVKDFSIIHYKKDNHKWKEITILHLEEKQKVINIIQDNERGTALTKTKIFENNIKTRLDNMKKIQKQKRKFD